MKFLIIHTRSLCYFSAGFFLDRLEECLEKNGHTVIRYNMDSETETFECLDEIDTKGIDAILDINSKLPFVINDDGDFWLDTLEAPFFNYILDHPLYHHPGLYQPLKNYHAIGIDRYHCKYMQEQYGHLQKVHYLPVGGSEAINARPFSDREDAILFTGTYSPIEKMEKELEDIISRFGYEYKKIALDLLDSWGFYEVPLEEELKKYLQRENREPNDYSFTSGFGELLNQLFPVDRILRNRLRKKIVDELSDELPVVVVGEGWEDSKPSMFYANAVELNGRYKYVLDITPGFLSGIHDRASNAFANKACLITNMSKKAYRELIDEESLIYFSGTNVSEAIEKFLRNKSLAKDLGERGYDWYIDNLTWEKCAMMLESFLTY